MTRASQRHDCCVTGNQRQSKKLLAEHFEGLEDEEEEEAGAEEAEDEEEGNAGSGNDSDEDPDQTHKVSGWPESLDCTHSH